MYLLRLFAAVRRALPRVVPLFRHAGVPFWLKAATLLGALLIVSPLDVFGDIPVLGFVDDAVLLALLANAFVAIAARYAALPVGAFTEPPMKRATPVLLRLRP
jgi:uncharacterized membrane protein YkvA (DUF1232 family)